MKNQTCPSCGNERVAGAAYGLCPACVLKDALEADASAGELPLEEIYAAFPEFTDLEGIGRGGMGIVYRAKQPGLDRFVALKILDPSLSEDPGFEERFQREARTLAKLSHPNIVTIYDFGEREGFFWLTMELIDGVNLRQAMQSEGFSPKQVLEVIPQICSALQFAHDQGVTHRDIKPENILIDLQGHVRIADFGIARMVGETADFALTQTGSVLGSTPYMAPEQIETPEDVDHRVDIYSLGVVFYEMLTGGLPLGRFAAPSEKSTSDPNLDEVVFKTLAREREKRFQSARELDEGIKTAHQKVEFEGERQTGPSRQLDELCLFSWFGGVATFAVGALVNPIVAILGFLFALLGVIGCWVVLWKIKFRGYRDRHHRTLRFFVFWPSMIIVAASVGMILIFTEIYSSKTSRKEPLVSEVWEEVLPSPRTAVEEMITAAGTGDWNAFSGHLTSDYYQSALDGHHDPMELMQEIAKAEFAREKVREGKRVVVRITGVDGLPFLTLIWEGLGWKLEEPSGFRYKYSKPLEAVRTMVKGAKGDDHYLFERGLALPLFSSASENREEMLELKSLFRVLTNLKEGDDLSENPESVIVLANRKDQELRISLQLDRAVDSFYNGTETVISKEWRVTQIE